MEGSGRLGHGGAKNEIIRGFGLAIFEKTNREKNGGNNEEQNSHVGESLFSLAHQHR